ncbi:MAG: peptidoglycan-binding protein [Pseudomonadota bacterium]
MARAKLVYPLLFIMSCLSAGAFSKDAQDILDTMQQKQEQRWKGVDVYVVEQSVMGFSSKTWYQRTELNTPDGDTQTMFLPMIDNCPGPGSMTQEAFAMYAEDDEEAASEAAQQVRQMETLKRKAVLQGQETIDGRSAYHLRASDLEEAYDFGDQQMQISTMDVWVDTDKYVPLKMQLRGTAMSDGETRNITMESLQSDYRDVPGSNMYESYRHSVAMTGMLDKQQQAELKEAQAQMAEMEKELAGMPAAQRQMMEGMLGPQMEKLRNMADGGGFKTDVVIASISVNPALPDAEDCNSVGVASYTSAAAAAPVQKTPAATAPADPEKALTSQVQESLLKLGYDPGNTAGEASTQTVVAISQFQAENGMAVTGEVSPQLAGILAAHVSGGAKSASPSNDAALQVARQTCLEQKMEEAQAAQKTKEGLGSLFSGISKLAKQFGGIDMAETTNDIYQADSTYSDFAKAAEDLGLTEDDIAECQNPG